MSTTAANAVPPPLPPEFQQRAEIWRGPGIDRDALIGAVVLTVFLHLFVYWVLPRDVFLPPAYKNNFADAVEVVLEPFPEKPTDQEYVRATPNVPEEKPEQTTNISDRDQVAAQEETVPPNPDNTPFIEGDMEDSNRLVQGDPFQQEMSSPQTTPDTQGQSPMNEQIPAPREQQQVALPDVPLFEPDFIEEEGVVMLPDPDTAVELPEETPEIPLQQNVRETSPYDGTGQARVPTPAQQASPDQKPSPRPRPRVTEVDTSYGPLKDNTRGGAVRVGRLAFDTEFSEFGKHWREVAESIEKQWRSILYGRKSIPFDGSMVAVRFYLTREGYIEDVEILDATAGHVAQQVAKDAILAPQPFKKFTPDMIATVGERTVCVIRFYY